MEIGQTKTGKMGEKSSSQSAGLLFSRLTLLLGLLALGGAVWTRQAGLVAVLAVCLAAGLLGQLWSRLCLKRVVCERRVSETRVFPGDLLRVGLRLENRKVLPLPWVEVEDRPPNGLDAEQEARLEAREEAGWATGAAGGGSAAGRSDDGGLGHASVIRSAAVSWYSAVNWTYLLKASRRGYYPLPPMRVSSGDIFGLYRCSRESQGRDCVIVYPQLRDPGDPVLPSLNPVGDSSSTNRLFEDASRTLGIRDYSPGDSLRRIHWKATARRAALQVRVYEPTTTLKPALFLVVDSFLMDPGEDIASSSFCEDLDHSSSGQDLYEYAISLTASLARDLIEKNAQVGLFLNCRQADTGLAATIPPGGGVTQLSVILEALAKATSLPALPFNDFFEAERCHLSFGTTPVFVAGSVTPGLRTILADVVGRGYRPLALVTGQMPPERPAGVAWHLLRPGTGDGVTGRGAQVQE